MANRLAHLFQGFTLTGELATDAPAFLRYHGQAGVAAHVELVATNALAIAAQVGVDPAAATTAAWLHDISLVLPYAAMVDMAAEYGVTVLPEEQQVPALLHGKLSAVFAAERFGVQNLAVLAAMRCHTTLRADPTLLDKTLFVADKLSWDPADAPWREELRSALCQSLDHAVWFFLERGWQERERMPVVHPWFEQAHAQFSLRKPADGKA